MIPNNPYSNNEMLKQVWDVESNRYCGDCLKPLDLNEGVHVLLVPAVILVCGVCNAIHSSEKFVEARRSLNSKKQSFTAKFITKNMVL